MSEATPLDENELVFSALYLLANPVMGDAPSWQEITDWKRRLLSAERSAEVLSHIANNPVYFQQWLDVNTAEQWIEEEADDREQAAITPQPDLARDEPTRLEPRTRLTGSQHDKTPGRLLSSARLWWNALINKPLLAYGSALAAVVLAVLIAPLLRETGNSGMSDKIDRSLDSYIAGNPGGSVTAPVRRSTRSLGGLLGDVTPQEVERHHFADGLRRSLSILLTEPDKSWSQWSTGLPVKNMDCDEAADAPHCRAVAADFRAIGQWTLLGFFACQQLATHEDEVFWTTQYALYEELALSPAMANSVVLKPAMSRHQPRTPESLCTAIQEMIAAG